MLVIDADAHVLETERTWDYLDPADQQYRPVLVAPRDDATHEHWMIDGKLRGLRFATLTEQEVARRAERSGRNVATLLASREMNDVELRLQVHTLEVKVATLEGLVARLLERVG